MHRKLFLGSNSADQGIRIVGDICFATVNKMTAIVTN